MPPLPRTLFIGRARPAGPQSTWSPRSVLVELSVSLGVTVLLPSLPATLAHRLLARCMIRSRGIAACYLPRSRCWTRSGTSAVRWSSVGRRRSVKAPCLRRHGAAPLHRFCFATESRPAPWRDLPHRMRPQVGLFRPMSHRRYWSPSDRRPCLTAMSRPRSGRLCLQSRPSRDGTRRLIHIEGRGTLRNAGGLWRAQERLRLLSKALTRPSARYGSREDPPAKRSGGSRRGVRGSSPAWHGGTLGGRTPLMECRRSLEPHSPCDPIGQRRLFSALWSRSV